MKSLTELELHDVGVPLLEEGAVVLRLAARRLQMDHVPVSLGRGHRALATVRHEVSLIWEMIIKVINYVITW